MYDFGESGILINLQNTEYMLRRHIRDRMRDREKTDKLCLSQCGLWNSSMTITHKTFRHTEPEASPVR